MYLGGGYRAYAPDSPSRRALELPSPLFESQLSLPLSPRHELSYVSLSPQTFSNFASDRTARVLVRTGVEYVVDARIFWNSMSEGPTGYTAYSHTGWGAVQGERQKRDSWRKSIDRRRGMSAGDIEFVPFSIEAGGVWGPAAKKFFRECLALADDDRDIDLYHWSSSKFSAAWLDTLSVLVARGRAQVGVAAATTDWPKRIRDMRYADQDDRGTAD